MWQVIDTLSQLDSFFQLFSQIIWYSRACFNELYLNSLAQLIKILYAGHHLELINAYFYDFIKRKYIYFPFLMGNIHDSLYNIENLVLL